MWVSTCPTSTMLFLQVVGFLCLLVFVCGSHFMGATVRFKTDPDVPNKATFYWKASWRIGRGPCSASTCTADDIGRYGTNFDSGSNGGNQFECHIGCTDANDLGVLAGHEYWITAVNTADDYEMGENEFTHTFASSGPFNVGLYGWAWRNLDVIVADNPAWKVYVKVQFGDRSDTGKPNNSPVTSSLPIYNLQFDCEGKARLPTTDPDGDRVICRWGTTDEECGDVCNALPGVVINETTCEFTIEADPSTYVTGGWYVGSVVLEDFPNADITLNGVNYTTTDALSRVPVQFLVKTPSFASECAAKPVFVSPTPDQGTVYYLEPSQSVGILMYATNEQDPSATIVKFETVAPNGFITSDVLDDPEGRSGVKYMALYWTPSDSQSGANTICFMAVDSSGKSSEYRCVYVYANDVDECESNPCQNGAVCNNLENIYTCTCTTGSAGYNCELDVVDDCLTSSCSIHSTCVDGLNTYTCLCDSGYTGSLCNTDIDECASSPCLNGGTCTDGSDAYVCSCNSGYEGDLCEKDVDECAGSPCQNSGTCLNLFDSYHCVCGGGYTGSDCQTDIDECSSSPCGAGASCLDGVNSYTCQCANGWNGANCDQNNDECASSPCSNEGVCVDDIDGYTCICTNGWNGTNCELDINECDSSPCANGGVCINSINGYTCNCADGWNGIHCEGNINECDSSPCQNGGACTDGINGYNCTCTDTYNGTDCQHTVQLNYCSSSPCANDGLCTNNFLNYSCGCTAGWSGATCETNINECDSSPCRNEGVCVDDIDGYTCICTNGWNGTNCELDINECDSQPCVHGSCINVDKSYMCSCEAGYEGDNCEYDIHECASGPCHRNATCIDLVGSYKCTCQPGATGINCDENIAECSSNPCLNGATCSENAVEGYTCHCVEGFTGEACQTDIDDCISSPCANNGTCTDLVSGYSCSCAEHWIGELCEETEKRLCSCESYGEWSGMKVNVVCECVEDFKMTTYRHVLDKSMPCHRNSYVILIAAMAGFLIASFIFSIGILVKDLKRRYNLLLNGQDPNDPRSQDMMNDHSPNAVSPSPIHLDIPKTPKPTL